MGPPHTHRNAWQEPHAPDSAVSCSALWESHQSPCNSHLNTVYSGVSEAPRGFSDLVNWQIFTEVMASAVSTWKLPRHTKAKCLEWKGIGHWLRWPSDYMLTPLGSLSVCSLLDTHFSQHKQTHGSSAAHWPLSCPQCCPPEGHPSVPSAHGRLRVARLPRAAHAHAGSLLSVWLIFLLWCYCPWHSVTLTCTWLHSAF